MRKLILRNGFSPGDIVMLTAAVRDLHRCHPGQFLTDVRTACPELWENNPFITPLKEDEPDVELIECSYPLIDHCNDRPYHCLHGFIEFLNERLSLNIKPSAFKGDIHLSDQERAWYSQVHELTGQDTPFWIVAAGGKHDLTIKWWSSERYQEVVDYFGGRILFVQVGNLGHHHPQLRGVVDLRGRTTLRELVRLVYHSQGVLCGVTALMHLAAAVESRCPLRQARPCVVVAGAREPAHWEAYPDHQFIHTNGALACCSQGGCWRDRVKPLGDGDRRDRSENLCLDVADELPRCMHMITAREVCRRIELYFEGGRARYLSANHQAGAQKGIRASHRNPFDQQPLHLASARAALETFLKNLPAYPGGMEGRGIVLCGGGVRYFTNAWVCINMLRQLGCRLPVQLWYLGRQEMDQTMIELLQPLGVICIDALQVRRRRPVRRLGGWELKPYAILHSSFQEILFLDADNMPVRNPEFLFESEEFKRTGAVFWPDYGHPADRSLPIWRSCGLKRPREREFESGQMLFDKRRCWAALRLSLWFNEHSDFYYQFLHGDKETFHLAFRKLKTAYTLVKTPIKKLVGTMCQHDFAGHRLFQHRNTDKWNLLLHNRRVRGFRLEADCRNHIRMLQEQWDGRVSLFRQAPLARTTNKSSSQIVAVMISCSLRKSVRLATLRRLGRTDWDRSALTVIEDTSSHADPQVRQTETALRALVHGLASGARHVLFLEDDLDFNHHLLHNLRQWSLVQQDQIGLASLYNPGVREAACDLAGNAYIVRPQFVFGSQSFLLSRPVLANVVQNWTSVAGMQDIRMASLAGRLRLPIYYHVPSLVQHVGRNSTWGGGFHHARDFDASWRAESRSNGIESRLEVG